jgi:hypothetical protein
MKGKRELIFAVVILFITSAVNWSKSSLPVWILGMSTIILFYYIAIEKNWKTEDQKLLSFLKKNEPKLWLLLALFSIINIVAVFNYRPERMIMGYPAYVWLLIFGIILFFYSIIVYAFVSVIERENKEKPTLIEWYKLAIPKEVILHFGWRKESMCYEITPLGILISGEKDEQ